MMTRVNFFLALAATLFIPLYAPHLHLIYFAPYIISCFYKYERFPALCRALFAGLIIDLLSSSPLFGMSSVSYCLATMAIYGQKRNFFPEKVTTLPIMTFLFSFISSASLALLFLIFGSNYVFSWRWLVTDLIEMPILDALYALPFQLTLKITKMKWYDRFRKRDRQSTL